MINKLNSITMSTIPKNEIGKLAEDYWNKRKEKGETEFAEPVDYMVGFVDGYQLATDGREELEKDCESWENSAITWEAKFNGLQSSLKDKDQEIERLNKVISGLVEDYNKLQEQADIWKFESGN